MREVKKWKGICIHHSATVDSGTLSWDAIKKYHTETNKWDDIGYHFGIELVGDEVITLAGRDLRYAGAHCPELNGTHIGICVVGDYDKEKPSYQHTAQLADVVAGLCLIFDIDPSNIAYHNEYSQKTCPGKLFMPKSTLIENVKRRL